MQLGKVSQSLNTQLDSPKQNELKGHKLHKFLSESAVKIKLGVLQLFFSKTVGSVLISRKKYTPQRIIKEIRSPLS